MRQLKQILDPIVDEMERSAIRYSALIDSVRMIHTMLLSTQLELKMLKESLVEDFTDYPADKKPN